MGLEYGLPEHMLKPEGMLTFHRWFLKIAEPKCGKYHQKRIKVDL